MTAQVIPLHRDCVICEGSGRYQIRQVAPTQSGGDSLPWGGVVLPCPHTVGARMLRGGGDAA